MLFKCEHSELCIYLSIFVVFLFLINNVKISVKTPSFFIYSEINPKKKLNQKKCVFIYLID